jgi:IrrE N-terminal-like domain
VTLFLPFTPAGKKTELDAVRVKTHLGLGSYASVDPYGVLPHVPARLINPEECRLFSEAALATLLSNGSDDLSAVALFRSPFSGEWLVHVNPCHDVHRRRASLMEEIVHIVLDHPRTSILLDARARRQTYDKAVEDEAFNVGAACIIPYRALFNAVKRDRTAIPQLAEQYNMSEEYIVYRIKRAGLSNVYKANVGPLTT